MLSCFITTSQGSPAYRISWWKDDEPLYIDNIRVSAIGQDLINVSPAKISDAGIYGCKVTFSSTTIRKTIRITIEAVAAVEPVRRHVTAFVGQTARLECKGHVQGMKWFRHRNSLQTNEKYEIGLGSLTIKSVQISDSGSFYCKSGQSIASIHLTVRQPPVPRLTVEPQSIIALDGDMAILGCKSSFRLYWLKYISEEDSERKVLQVDGSLKFDRVSTGDAGMYQCVAENDYGKADSAIVYLVVKRRDNPSQIIARQRNRNQPQLALISCRFSNFAYQGLSIEWQKDEKNIFAEKNSEKYSQPFSDESEGSALLIQNATCYESGKYSCLLNFQNQRKILCSINVAIEELPKPPEDVRVTFECSEFRNGLFISWSKSACFQPKRYEVTVTIIDTTRQSFRSLVNSVAFDANSFYLNLSDALSSCSACNLIFGIEVQSVGAMGKSMKALPRIVSATGLRRVCSSEPDFIPVLSEGKVLKLKLKLKDSHCSCAKSSQILNLGERMKYTMKTFLLAAIQNPSLVLSDEVVLPLDDALSTFVYYAAMNDLTYQEAVNAAVQASSILRQSNLEISTECRVSFVECTTLHVDGMFRNDNTCVVGSTACPVPSSLRRIGKWCNPWFLKN
ncbi:contactin-3-like isoform X2 [Oscarella lobularis]